VLGVRISVEHERNVGISNDVTGAAEISKGESSKEEI